MRTLPFKNMVPRAELREKPVVPLVSGGWLDFDASSLCLPLQQSGQTVRSSQGYSTGIGFLQPQKHSHLGRSIGRTGRPKTSFGGLYYQPQLSSTCSWISKEYCQNSKPPAPRKEPQLRHWRGDGQTRKSFPASISPGLHRFCLLGSRSMNSST